MEGHFRGIHLVIRPVINRGMNADNRKASENTGLCSLLDTLADSGNIFLRNYSAHNLRIELEKLFSVGIHGLKANLTVSVLSAAA